ncbi:MAG: DUF4124 domain-containing protein [Burkholderiaceae bacterium]
MKSTVSSFARLGLLAMALALGSTAVLAGSIWKWRDKDGRVQVSDRPPPVDVPDKDILQRPTGARAPMPAPAATAASDAGGDVVVRGDPALEAKRTKAEAEKAAAEKAKKDADKAKRDHARLETCQRARNQLAALEGGQRMARVNDKGEREVLDDAGREAEIARTREIANSSCD